MAVAVQVAPVVPAARLPAEPVVLRVEPAVPRAEPVVLRAELVEPVVPAVQPGTERLRGAIAV